MRYSTSRFTTGRSPRSPSTRVTPTRSTSSGRATRARRTTRTTLSRSWSAQHGRLVSDPCLSGSDISLQFCGVSTSASERSPQQQLPERQADQARTPGSWNRRQAAVQALLARLPTSGRRSTAWQWEPAESLWLMLRTDRQDGFSHDLANRGHDNGGPHGQQK